MGKEIIITDIKNLIRETNDNSLTEDWWDIIKKKYNLKTFENKLGSKFDLS